MTRCRDIVVKNFPNERPAGGWASIYTQLHASTIAGCWMFYFCSLQCGSTPLLSQLNFSAAIKHLHNNGNSMSVCNLQISELIWQSNNRWQYRSLGQRTLNVWSSRWTDAELRALTTAMIPLKLFSSWKTIITSSIRDTTATRSSRFSVSTMHFSSQNVNYTCSTRQHHHSQHTQHCRPEVSTLWNQK